MALFRKKLHTAGRRRPQAESRQERAFSYNNTGSRPEAGPNTGREGGRERGPAKKPAAASSWKRFWLQRFGFIILFGALLICTVNILSLSPHAKLLPLKSADNGSFLRDQATYQAAADKLLASSLWNRNKITIDTGSFNRQMTQQFPELSSVSVALPLLAHRPVVYLQPAQPALVLAADKGSFVIDNRGKALLAADNSPSQSKLPQVVDQSGLQIQLHRQVLSSDDVNFIQTVVAQLAARHMIVSSLVLPAGTSELDAHIAGQTYFVKFNLHDNNPRQQAGTFLATIAQLQRKNAPPGKYIDVRVAGRAYYQ
jgi:hypothetical protein